MLFGVNQHDAYSLFAENRSQHRTRQAVAEDSYVEVMFGFLDYHRPVGCCSHLDERRSPRETGAISGEHHKITLFDASCLERIDEADYHVCLLQVTVVHP